MTDAPKKPLPRWAIVLLVLVFGPAAIAAVIGLNSSDTSSPAAPAAPTATARPVPQPAAKADKSRDRALQAAGFAAVSLKQSMKDPKAFELVSLVVSPSNAGCFTYRSTNGFGAHIQSEAVLTPGGKMILKDQSPGAFATAWNKNCSSGDGDDIAPYLAENHVLD